MLRLILGEDWIANREEVLRRVSTDVAEKKGNRILMVPELISHDTERRLCAAAGDTASRFAEVLSFTRLIRRVSEAQQQVPGECLDGGGRLIAMAAATKMLSSKLKSYASVETRPEFLSGLLDAVDEFKRCCITPEELRDASGRTEGTLAQKLSELSLILEGYDSVCAMGKQDPRDQVNWLLEQLECSDFAENHCFYIDGFPDFTLQHMEILYHLIRVSPLVTISLNCDRERSSLAAFEKAGKTAADLLQEAHRHQIEVEIVHVAPRNDALGYLREKLFQGQIAPQEELQDCLRLTRADTIFDECMAAAEQVRELAVQGCRYRDIGIVCADIEHYRGIVSLVFRRCGIPVYLSGTDDILEKTAVATVLSALDAAMEGMEQKDVLRYLKSVLSPLEPDTCDIVENYALLWGIRGEKWGKEWTWHPRGLGEDWKDEDREALQKLNQARTIGISPLMTLRREMRDSTTIGDQVQALNRFLEQIGLADGLEKLAQEAEVQGDNRAAQEYNQLWEIMVTAMEQLQGVLGESHWEPETFSRLFRLLLSQYDVGTIPTVLDAVTVGPVSAMRCQQVRHLLVLGAEEGMLPSYGGSTGVLTDQERTEIRRLGVSLTGGAMEGVAAEFAEIYGCFCGATESVAVSCPSGQTAFVYRRLCDMVGMKEGIGVDPGPGPGLSDPWEAGAYLARWKEEKIAAELNVSEGYQDVKSRASFSLGTVEPEHIKKLYGKQLALSASQIDQQAECKLAYFLKYGLRAKERKEAEVDSAEFGTFVHSVLEQTARKVMELGGFHEVSLEQTMEISHEYAQQYAKERFADLDSDRLSYLFDRNGQELDAVIEELWLELSEAEFAPAAFELNFDLRGEMPPIRIPEGKMAAIVRGYVDRVDCFNDGYRNFFRVVDYKTGKKTFDYCDVFNGVGLQMLLYLFALEQGGEKLLGDHPLSAGVQYFPARVPYMSEDGRLDPQEAAEKRISEMKRRGLVLLDEAVLEAMDPEEGMPRLSVKCKKDGTITGDVADREQFNLLRKYVFHMLGNMVDEIADGKVQPNPYTRGSAHSACAFCPFGAVCAREREKGRRNYKTMTAQRFWDEIAREEEIDG